MLKLLYYYYDQQGNRLKKSELNKAKFFVVRNKGFGIDDIHQFPPRLKVLDKQNFIKDLEEFYNEKYLLETVQSIFPLSPNWNYETFDSNGRQLKSEINKNSKFYTLYFNNKFITSDSFPKRLSPTSKKKFLDQLSILIEKELKKEQLVEKYPFLYDESIVEGVELIELTREVSSIGYFYGDYYNSSAIYNWKDVDPTKTRFSSVIVREEFFRPIDVTENLDRIVSAIRALVKDQAQILLTMLSTNMSRLWQVVVKLVPLNKDGTITNRDFKVISTPQVPSLGNLTEMIERNLRADIYSSIENYSEIFNELVGVESIDLKLMGN